MAQATVIEAIKDYLASLPARGIHSRRAILYGSHAKGTADEWSDIDLIVLAPEFDIEKTHKMVHEMWLARGEMNAPIEPIACGEEEWETDDSRPILEIARREGIEVSL